MGDAAGVVGVLADGDEPEQDFLGGGLLSGRQFGPGVLGGFGDRADHAARLAVAGDGEAAPFPVLPGGGHDVGEQGEGARVVGAAAGMAARTAQFGDHQLFEAGFQVQADRAGRARDRLRQFVRAHGAEQVGAVFERLLEDQVVQAVGVEVGAQGDDDGDRIVGAGGAAVQGGEEVLAGALVGAGGEELLELIDDQQAAG